MGAVSEACFLCFARPGDRCGWGELVGSALSWRSLWSAASSRRFCTSRSDDEHGKPSPVAALSYAKSKTLLCRDNGVTKTTTATAQQQQQQQHRPATSQSGESSPHSKGYRVFQAWPAAWFRGLPKAGQCLRAVSEACFLCFARPGDRCGWRSPWGVH